MSEVKDRAKEWIAKPKPPVHFQQDTYFVEPEYVMEVSVCAPTLLGKQAVVLPAQKVWEEVSAVYKFPFPLFDYQAATVDALSIYKSTGIWFEVGGGKTITGIVMALWQRMADNGQIVVIMPPILLHQWKAVFDSIEGVGTTLIYNGTPAVRKALPLTECKVVLMSIQIFKNDFEYLYDVFEGKPCSLIVDEAVSIKNPSTQNHKCVEAWKDEDKSIVVLAKAKRQKKLAAKKDDTVHKDKVAQQKAAKEAKEQKAKLAAQETMAFEDILSQLSALDSE